MRSVIRVGRHRFATVNHGLDLIDRYLSRKHLAQGVPTEDQSLDLPFGAQ